MIAIQFNRVSSNKLYIQIYDQILSEIQSGTLQLGDKLPTERELCAQFGVSRAPIRQALSALEMKGYIYSRQGEGVYVKNTKVQEEVLADESLINSVSPEDIVEARMNIEPLIASLAAQRATSDEIGLLRKTIKQMELETEAGHYVPETDERLHMEIARASHNDLFIQFITVIIQAMKQQEMWRFIRDRTVTRPDYRDTNFLEHKEIIDAIEKKQADKASELMTQHMQNLFNRYWKD
ncbi:FadR/GntR family transcriptional regulator [Paenibacillus polygoni]|uniref:FadR/GntR family transcriptional regulator n=1 Tax=Paenibacillus polygoni TaxID=3050112 RepID=A0ABY8X7G9_9BACL|nr:FadR/GntR family transcriptional regulator [Paenibacillus polygoni]WIV19120.1 FadR/GntR family transcriptional regulator [Paenibacillus polygoni]